MEAKMQTEVQGTIRCYAKEPFHSFECIGRGEIIGRRVETFLSSWRGIIRVQHSFLGLCGAKCFEGYLIKNSRRV